MKSIVIVALLAVGSCFAQNLRVVHVSGEIMKDRTKEKLNNGDRILPTDRISYSGSQPYCLLFDGQQKMALNVNGKTSGAVADLFELVQDRQLIATRGTENEAGVLTLEDYFVSPVYLMLNQEERIKLNRDMYAKGEEVAFFVVDGNDNRNMLELEDDDLVIQRGVIFSEDEMEKKVDIYIVNTSTGAYSREVTVTFKQVSADVIIEKGMLIQSMIEDKTSDEQIHEIFGFITQIYGPCTYSSFEKFYNKYLLSDE